MKFQSDLNATAIYDLDGVSLYYSMTTNDGKSLPEWLSFDS